jgi:DNA-binding MarR family transcriptional regulator
VELTDKGRAAHRAVYAAHANRAAALFATLDHNDQQALLDLLHRLLDTLAATSAAEGRPLNLDTEAFRSG